jgi:phosphatidylglycerol:prolipoprotein diacylglycerol transferase
MLVHPQFDPVAIHLGPLAVRWYGLMYLIGFVLFVVLGKIRARQNLLTGWHPRDVDDMLFYGVFGVILGGRLGYILFYKPMYYLAHPMETLALWQGGMSFHGGFLGVRSLWCMCPDSAQALAGRDRLRRAADSPGIASLDWLGNHQR